MIINGSSADTFQQCRTKVWNWRELRLEPVREAEPLTIGSSFHAGQAALYKGASLIEAQQLVEETYHAEKGPQMVLPEEQEQIRINIRFAQNSIAEHAKHWANDPFEVLMPEVKFRVELPGTEHHCWFVHRLLHPDETYTIEHSFSHPEWSQCNDPKCWQPHFYTGTTDAVIVWRSTIWLLEHKTTGIFSPQYIDGFRMSKQPRGYLYGISKSTGVRPRGFILNVIQKPRKDAKDKTKPVGFVREPFVVEDRELVEYEKWITQVANDYETAFRTGNIYQNNHSCLSYNRRCYYWNSCLTGQHDEHEYAQRPSDYVDDQYYEVLGLQKDQPNVNS